MRSLNEPRQGFPPAPQGADPHDADPQQAGGPDGVRDLEDSGDEWWPLVDHGGES